MAETQRVFAANRIHIPRKHLEYLLDLDPSIDDRWRDRVGAILEEIEPDERKYVYSQYLQPKGIQLIAGDNQLIFKEPESLKQVVSRLQNVEVKGVGAKLLYAMERMRTTRDVNQFAGHMEGAMNLIDQFDVGENSSVRKEKTLVRHALLIDLVSLTRKAEWDVMRNRRAFTSPMIKQYAIEVFLKHQMMGYRFRTLPIGTLENDPHPFVREVIAPEARVRQCEIVQTDTAIFLIGPTHTSNQNPYSIRRFLQEDEVLGGAFFNVIMIPMDHLDDPNIQKTLQALLTRLVTLQRQMSDNIIEFIRELDSIRIRNLNPLLKAEIRADGTSLEWAINDRLSEFEEKLRLGILEKVQHALFHMASTQDDFEYLFINLRRLIGDLAFELRSFTAYSGAAWIYKAEMLDLKMLAFLRFIEKRKELVFVPIRPAPESGPSRKQLLLELSQTLNKGEKDIKPIQARLTDLTRKKKAHEALLNFLTGLIIRPPEPEALQRQIDAVKLNCFLAIARLFRRYDPIIVYVEKELIVPEIDGLRHYALMDGRDGLTHLPSIVRLHEVAEFFDIAAVRRVLGTLN